MTTSHFDYVTNLENFSMSGQLIPNAFFPIRNLFAKIELRLKEQSSHMRSRKGAARLANGERQNQRLSLALFFLRVSQAGQRLPPPSLPACLPKAGGRAARRGAHVGDRIAGAVAPLRRRDDGRGCEPSAAAPVASQTRQCATLLSRSPPPYFALYFARCCCPIPAVYIRDSRLSDLKRVDVGGELRQPDPDGGPRGGLLSLSDGWITRWRAPTTNGLGGHVQILYIAVVRTRTYP